MMTRLPVMLSTVSKITMMTTEFLCRLGGVRSKPTGRGGNVTTSLGVVDGSGLTKNQKGRTI